MKNTITFLCMAIFILMAMTSKGPATHIGLASGSNILNQMPETSAVRAVLDTFKYELDLQFQSKVDELKRKQELYKNEHANLNEIVRADREEELNAIQESIVQFQKTAQEAYEQKEAELMEPILESFQSALSIVAEDQGFTHVFNVDAANGSSLLLYAQDYARVDSLVINTITTIK